MGAKGAIDVKIDAGAVNEIIVYAGQMRSDVAARAEEIRTCCRNMEEEETLKGGDGDNIRQLFTDISAGITRVEKSLDYVVQTLNKKLEGIVQMYAGKNTGAASEAVQSAAKKTGVLAKE